MTMPIQEAFKRLEATPHLKRPLNEIDAAMFSGDSFFTMDNVLAMRAVLARWEKGLDQAMEIVVEGLI